jgi:hypothetical protein
MIQKIVERLARTKYVRESLEDQTDLKDLRKRHSTRIIFGLFLIGFSYIIGWPAVAALSFLAVYFQEPLIILIGGPITYGFSHLLFLAGAWLSGAEHARILMRQATKLLFRKILRHQLFC